MASPGSAAHYFRMILANDDRARTMHAAAAHTNRDLLPPDVAALLDRNERRTATRQQAAKRERSRAVDQGYGLEL